MDLHFHINISAVSFDIWQIVSLEQIQLSMHSYIGYILIITCYSFTSLLKNSRPKFITFLKMDKRPIGYQPGKSSILDKKVPKTTKYDHVESKLAGKTGTTVKDI